MTQPLCYSPYSLSSNLDQQSESSKFFSMITGVVSFQCIMAGKSNALMLLCCVVWTLVRHEPL